jgi:hypothetical protein
MRVAEALQRGHGADLDSVSGQIAAHYEAAGAIDKAIDWHVRAAEAAQRLHANRDAVHSLERALGLVGGVPAGAQRDSRELGLLTQLPVPLVAVEGYLSGRVTDVHERALALARALGIEPEPPLVRSLALATLTRGTSRARARSASSCAPEPSEMGTRCSGWRAPMCSGSRPTGRAGWRMRARSSR